MHCRGKRRIADAKGPHYLLDTVVVGAKVAWGEIQDEFAPGVTYGRVHELVYRPLNRLAGHCDSRTCLRLGLDGAGGIS